jgi:hypothetical protein
MVVSLELCHLNPGLRLWALVYSQQAISVGYHSFYVHVIFNRVKPSWLLATRSYNLFLAVVMSFETCQAGPQVHLGKSARTQPPCASNGIKADLSIGAKSWLLRSRLLTLTIVGSAAWSVISGSSCKAFLARAASLIQHASLDFFKGQDL